MVDSAIRGTLHRIRTGGRENERIASRPAAVYDGGNPTLKEERVMARTAVKSKKRAKVGAAKKPARVASKTSAKRVAAKGKTGVKSSGAKKKPAQMIERKAVAKKAGGAAAAHEGVFHKMMGRIKPLFRKPLDPRIKHMVEVFGEQAVKGLIAAYRETRDTAEAELREALARAEALKPSPVHGAWAWHELMTNDVAGSKRFYGELFGWEAYDLEMMPGFNYTLFKHQGKECGGMMALAPEHGHMPPGWGVYVTVDDVDAAAERAELLGGEVIVPPHDIPVGRWSMIKDPGGAMICLYRAVQNPR
jgi:predicted enzyme related to lactoylglutathione lyase